MFRKCLLSAFALLAASAAQAQTEDPRTCLIARVPADHAKLVETIRRSLFPNEPARGETVGEDTYRENAAKRCIASEGWSSSYTRPAATLLYGEVRAQLIGPRLRQAGFDLTRLDTHIAARSLKELLHLEWLSPRDSTFGDDWKVITGLLGRKPADAPQQELLLKYVQNRAIAERGLQVFAVMSRPDSTRYVSEDWQVLPALEANRPVIRERALTKEERSEVSRLASTFAKHPNQGGKRLATLQRLMELAQSGDKAAMIAARDALGYGVPYDVDTEYIHLDIFQDPFRRLTERLAAMWTAMIWHRFGYDDASRKYMKACVGGLYGEVSKHEADGVAASLDSDGTVIPVNSQGLRMDASEDGCGLTLLGVPAAQAQGRKVLQYYDKRGSFAQLGNREPRGDFAISGVRFVPIMGDVKFMQAKFERHLSMRRSGMLFEPSTGHYTFSTPTLIVTRPWYEHYALETGQYSLVNQADAQGNAVIAKRIREENTRLSNNWKNALALFKANPNNEGYRTSLMYAASALGGGFWTEYTRLTASSSPVSAAPRMIGSGTGSSGYREVEVRSYDSNGTYTGSTRMSAAWADIMKMTSAAGR